MPFLTAIPTWIVTASGLGSLSVAGKAARTYTLKRGGRN